MAQRQKNVTVEALDLDDDTETFERRMQFSLAAGRPLSALEIRADVPVEEGGERRYVTPEPSLPADVDTLTASEKQTFASLLKKVWAYKRNKALEEA